jgi:hypothetical protein
MSSLAQVILCRNKKGRGGAPAPEREIHASGGEAFSPKPSLYRVLRYCDGGRGWGLRRLARAGPGTEIGVLFNFRRVNLASIILPDPSANGSAFPYQTATLRPRLPAPLDRFLD